MGRCLIENIVDQFIMQQFDSFLKISTLFFLTTSIIIKTVQLAAVVVLTSLKRTSIESVVESVSVVFAGGVGISSASNDTSSSSASSLIETTPSSHLALISWHADRGFRLFSLIFLCCWIIVASLGLLNLLFRRFIIVMIMNVIVYLLGLLIESLLAVVLDATSWAYIVILVDLSTTFVLIAYSCWQTQAGMTFDPEEQANRYEKNLLAEKRKHTMSNSSTFRRFESIDA